MNQELSEEPCELGKTGLQTPPLGIGAWAWGDRFFWGYGRSFTEQDVIEAFEASLEAGINFFDTAEVYGSGRSERFLGQLAPGGVSRDGKKLVIATKFFPFPWRLWKGSLHSALRRSLKRLNMECVDLYQVHNPLPPVPVETWARSLGEAVQQGLTCTVGVSNYSTDQMRRTHAVLDKMGVPLASNQVEYSLLFRAPERNGLLQACQELGVTLIAYSPLAKGVLTGKYTPDNPPPGFRSRLYSRAKLAQIKKLIDRMREIGHAHGAKSPAQVAINWTIVKGTLPIPGAKTAIQARENIKALGWRLTSSEMAELDQISASLN
jgi:aryl-alcohol dehydrogenase-like predicted oxidoreductase